MATKYISLEAAIALTDQHCFESGYDAEWMEEELKRIPAADVIPVEWIEAQVISRLKLKRKNIKRQ